MSKRKHAQRNTAWKSGIEWLNHREGYPSPEERTAIVEMRKELLMQLMLLMVRNLDFHHPEYRAIVNQYGPQEVERALGRFRDRMNLPRIDYDVRAYREYRQGFALFGEGLTFHPMREWEGLRESRDTQLIKTIEENGELSWEEGPLDQALLVGWTDWDDLVPLAVPARPADFTCPAPGSYASPVAELLEYGSNFEVQYDYKDLRWKKAIPALARMALDPGLLSGWPGESASWAPWHAIHLLGLLEAWEFAPALAQLADLEDDWLSDHLPHTWADMGFGAIPTLWMILEDKTASTKVRGLAAEALFMLTEDDEAMTGLVITGFGKILQKETDFDPRLNAYLISFLMDMEGGVDALEDEIVDAFEDGRVDEDHVSFEDVFSDDDEEDDDEFDE